jgi:uroporphyrinogen decarboxylase
VVNSRERLLRTIAGEPIDRPPVAPFLHVNFIKEHRRRHDIDVVAETVRVCRDFDFDMVHRNCTPEYDDLLVEGPDWTPRVEETGNADHKVVTVTVDTPGGRLRRVTRSDRLYEYEWSCFLVEPPIKIRTDLDLFLRYQPPAPTIDVSPIVRARQAVGDDGIVAPWAQGAFNEVAYLMRGHAVLLDPLDDEGFYRAMIAHFLPRNLEKLRQFVAAGADLLSIGGNEANGRAAGPDYFRRYVLEYERQLVDAVHGFGGRVIYHNCGYASLLLPLLREIGMDVYESLTPPPFGDTRLDDALRIMSPIALMGGVDQIDLLRKATPDAVRRHAAELLAIAQGRGRFILGTSDYINENTPVENLRALREAVETT